MAEKKKQHYVPQFYLKLFSWGDKKAINIYNIHSQKVIWRGSLKNQCYEPYFYGKDLVVENAFGDIEDTASRIINQIIGSSSAPKRGTKEYLNILAYVLLQNSRTKHKAEEMDEINELIDSTVGKEGTVAREKLDPVGIKNDNPTAIPLSNMLQIIQVATDLMCKVLINKTGLNFITSDNPVVFYNRAYEQSKVMSHTGLACEGLKIILPISPKHILLFYDERIYKVGARKQCFAYVNVENDVQQFNDLQWLNALKNIYFNDRSLYSEIRRGADKNIKRRHTRKIRVNEYEGETKIDGMQATLLQIGKPDLNIRMNIHCIRQLKVLSEQEINGSKSFRNPEFVESYCEFLALVQKGKYKMNEFKTFIHDKRESS